MTLKKPFLYRLESFLWDVVDLVFPPTCPGCQTVGSPWCEDCKQSVIRMNGRVCQVCGENCQQDICTRCKQTRPLFIQARSWAVFKQPIRGALHSLKYRQNIGLGQALAESISPGLDELNWPVQAIIPIPISQQRQRERGYNQVALVARPLAQLNSLEYLPAGLRRARHTRSQVGLNVEERKHNLKDAFLADPQRVAGKQILLMDDVCTTGTTLAEAARALIDSGAKSVYAFTIARAISHKDA